MRQPKLLGKKVPRSKLSQYLLLSSLICLIASLGILVLTYQPVIYEEVKYAVAKPKSNVVIVPKDQNFGIVIPKIGANAKVIENVDPYTPGVYQVALQKGVAHALGTGLPGEKANIFIFAHSSGNFYQANRYNSVFYLLHKLEIGDEVKVYFKKSLFSYRVTELEYVKPERVEFLNRQAVEETLTLMTCWPPGTTSERLIVKAKRVSNP